MLFLKFPPVIKPPPPVTALPPWKAPSAWDNFQTKTPPKDKPKIGKNSPFFESQKRNSIIKEAWAACGIEVGDVCTMALEPEKYGDLYVERILENYAQYPKELDWPDHDRPMIVKCAYQDQEGNTKRIWCTVDILKLKPE